MSVIPRPGPLSRLARRRTEDRSDPIIQPSEAVRRLRPYEPVSSLDRIAAMEGGPEPFKLDWNESTIGPSPVVEEALRSFLSREPHLNWYPPLGASPALLQGLADYTGLPPDHILVTSGSDAGLDLVCTTYLDPGDRVVVPYPTYTHFLVFAGARASRIEPVTYDDPFRGNLRRILAAMGPDARLLYLVNPNNPTGVLYHPEEVRRLLQAASRTVVVVDEAYFEFGGHTCAPLVRDYQNLVVIRTFSKVFGIAGLRVGYLLACPDRLKDMRRVHNPKSVNVLGQVAAAAALRDLDHIRRYVAEVDRSKELFHRTLTDRGIEVRVTPANWNLVRVPDPAAALVALEEERIFVRDRSCFPQLHGFIRFSLGTVEHTREVLARTERAFARLGWL